MTTVGKLVGMYENGMGGRVIDTRVTYFHGLSRSLIGHYFDVPLNDISGKMTAKDFRSASCIGLRFESFQSGTQKKRYTLMVSRDGSHISLE